MVYPGINIAAYDAPVDLQDKDVVAVGSYVLDHVYPMKPKILIRYPTEIDLRFSH